MTTEQFPENHAEAQALHRAQRLRKIIFPMALLVISAVALIVGLFLLVLVQGSTVEVSVIADLLCSLFCLVPMVLIGAVLVIVTGAMSGAMFVLTEKTSEGMAKADLAVKRAGEKVAQGADKAALPVIKAGGAVAFVRRLLKGPPKTRKRKE